MPKRAVKTVQEFQLDTYEVDDGHLEFVSIRASFDEDGLTFTNYVDRWGKYEAANRFHLTPKALEKLEGLLAERKKK